MRRKISLLILMLFILIACNESRTTFFSLTEEEFSTVANDSLVILVDSDGPEIELTGDLWLTGGKCLISMASPEIDTTFKNVYTFVSDTAMSDTTYFENFIERIDTIYLADTINRFDTIWGTNRIDTFNLDSIFVIDTIYSIDTVFLNRVIYQETFETADKYSINQKFERIQGTWIFKYSLEKIYTEYPSGDLDFNIKYED